MKKILMFFMFLMMTGMIGFSNGIPQNLRLDGQNDFVTCKYICVGVNIYTNFSANGFPIISKGIVFSTSHNPTLANNVTYWPTQYWNGCETCGFQISSNMGGINCQPSTTYYVRAFATNYYGTNYCAEKSFTTLPGVCVLPIKNDENPYAFLYSTSLSS
jgi:hypothetical protein